MVQGVPNSMRSWKLWEYEENQYVFSDSICIYSILSVEDNFNFYSNLSLVNIFTLISQFALFPKLI